MPQQASRNLQFSVQYIEYLDISSASNHRSKRHLRKGAYPETKPLNVATPRIQALYMVNRTSGERVNPRTTPPWGMDRATSDKHYTCLTTTKVAYYPFHTGDDGS